MAFLSDPELATLAGMETVYSAVLIHLDFESDPMRVWSGAGDLKTLDGNSWQGLGEFVSVSGLEQAIGGVASSARFTLSGVDPNLLVIAADAADQIKGRDITVYGQFFDDTGRPFANPFSMWAGIMDVLEYQMDGDQKRVIDLTAESLFSRRGRPAYGLNSDRDQQARFPGDLGMSFVASIANKTVPWPDF